MKATLKKALRFAIAAVIVWTLVYMIIRADDKEQETGFHKTQYQGRF
jgi:pyruvate dehydrogenase complex dehydrogenase (E1) component